MKKNLVLSILFLIGGLYILFMVGYLGMNDLSGAVLTMYSMVQLSFSALMFHAYKGR